MIRLVPVVEPVLTQRPQLAASVAVFRGDKVLLAKRARAPASGLYSLPGGRIEAGERLEEGVMRELFEETGLQASVIGFVEHVEIIERDSAGKLNLHVVIAVFAAEWIGGEARLSEEVSDLTWVDPLKPGDLPMTAGLPRILARAAAIAREAGLG